MSDVSSEVLSFSQPSCVPFISTNHQPVVAILLNTLSQETKRVAEALWKLWACIWSEKTKLNCFNKQPYPSHICLSVVLDYLSSFRELTGVQQGLEYLCNLMMYVDVYVNENLRCAEGNKSCVHLPCKISHPQLVSGRVYLLLAEPVKSTTCNCFEESDLTVKLSRRFPSTRSFHANAFSWNWRFC